MDNHQPENHQPLAYHDDDFLESTDARPLRILAEYIETLRRFKQENIQDTVVFFGSARVDSREDANRALLKLKSAKGRNTAAHATALKRGRKAVQWSRYYEDARQLARRLTEWSLGLEQPRHRFVVTSGGGPGIMEAANRGAHEAGGKTIGLNIRLPFEQGPNKYITENLHFEFHYFFMRKFWFAYLAKALVVFPGGFGTCDELFEILTVVQTHKLAKKILVIVYGKEYWKSVLNLDALVDAGTISPEDVNGFTMVDTPEEAFEVLKEGLTRHHLQPQPARPVPEEGPEIAKTLP